MIQMRNQLTRLEFDEVNVKQKREKLRMAMLALIGIAVAFIFQAGNKFVDRGAPKYRIDLDVNIVGKDSGVWTEEKQILPGY